MTKENINIKTQQTAPDPDPERLAIMPGLWKISIQAGGQVLFEITKKGNFLVQYIDQGNIKGIEIVWFDEQSEINRTSYPDNPEIILEYGYTIGDETLTVSLDTAGHKRKIKTKLRNDCNKIITRWEFAEEN